jgi:4-diphosphocytidyl-2-C-methyl-D-erythritol kinase
MTNTMQTRSYAKINLFLDILNRRPNGYHDILTLFHSIKLSDSISITIDSSLNLMGDEHFRFNVDLTCSNPAIPTDKTNLIHQAVTLMVEEHWKNKGQNLHFTINVEKNIPVGSGMAGGSSNAATTILLLNHMLELNLEVEQLLALGTRIGADVPFCITKGTAVGRGIGEKLDFIEKFPHLHFVLIIPNFGIDTRWAYENLKLKSLTEHPDLADLLINLQKNELTMAGNHLYNALETVVSPRYTEISAIKKNLLSVGCDGALMSGSGSTVFGYHGGHVLRNRVEKAFENMDVQIIYSESLS